MDKLGMSKRLPIIFFLAAALILSAFLWTRNKANVFSRISVDLYADVTPSELSSAGSLEAGQKLRVVTKRPPWILVQAG